MSNAAMVAERYIAIWNETDEEHRRALLAEMWTEDCTYIDPLMSGKGHDQIDSMIAAVHQRFPGFRFALLGTPDGDADRVRFSWELGPDGGEGLVKGTDFVVLESGRLKSVYGFLDQVPVGA